MSEPKPALQIEVPEPPADPAAVSSLLSCGDIEVKGRMPWSSNATFLVEVCGAPGRCFAIYKPERGERPLWDFPPGLWRREVAAHRLAAALGWNFVPVTVPRSDAPLGEGSLQQFVSFDPDAHYFTLYEDEATHDQLRRFAVFDLLINNTDRKSGHLLRDADRPDLGHRPRAGVPPREQAAHGDLGVRRRGHAGRRGRAGGPTRPSAGSRSRCRSSSTPSSATRC